MAFIFFVMIVIALLLLILARLMRIEDRMLQVEHIVDRRWKDETEIPWEDGELLFGSLAERELGAHDAQWWREVIRKYGLRYRATPDRESHLHD